MPVSRRRALGLGLAAVAASVAGCDNPTPGRPTSASGGPLASSSAQPESTSGTDPLSLALADTLRRYTKPSKENPDHPTYAGAVALVTVGGKTIASAVVGEAVRYATGPVLLPERDRVPMRSDSIFDLASLTKVYTAILALRLADQGRVGLDEPVAAHLQEWAAGGISAVTLAQLLAHTGGLPVGPKSFSGLTSEAARWKAVLTTGTVSAPGSLFRYSGTGLMVVGRLIEAVTGQPLDQALVASITEPLRLRYTGFRPLSWLPSADRGRLVATDARTSRGLLRGVVHDDICNRLGGVAGHAGVFGTAAEVAAVAQMLLDYGTLGEVQIVSSAIVERMRRNANRGLPFVDAERPFRTSDHGLGVELDQPWFMGRLASPETFGHTGFTGTSFVCDPHRDLVLVLLTNRAHPNWTWANPDPIRAIVADVVAEHVR
jgi:CubicO group peptidase (beta-lactamase class C family)